MKWNVVYVCIGVFLLVVLSGSYIVSMSLQGGAVRTAEPEAYPAVDDSLVSARTQASARPQPSSQVVRTSVASKPVVEKEVATTSSTASSNTSAETLTDVCERSQPRPGFTCIVHEAYPGTAFYAPETAYDTSDVASWKTMSWAVPGTSYSGIQVAYPEGWEINTSGNPHTIDLVARSFSGEDVLSAQVWLSAISYDGDFDEFADTYIKSLSLPKVRSHDVYADATPSQHYFTGTTYDFKERSEYFFALYIYKTDDNLAHVLGVKTLGTLGGTDVMSRIVSEILKTVRLFKEQE